MTWTSLKHKRQVCFPSSGHQEYQIPYKKTTTLESVIQTLVLLLLNVNSLTAREKIKPKLHLSVCEHAASPILRCDAQVENNLGACLITHQRNQKDTARYTITAYVRVSVCIMCFV